MLRILIKKQLYEVFRSFFFIGKKNRMRSRWMTAVCFGLFVIFGLGIIGGMFTGLSLVLCGPLMSAGIGWFYFLLMGAMAVILGVFGSVFSTYSSLYLAKDNDLLLAMPIKVGDIIAARLMIVWILGTLYSALVFLPAMIVYLAKAGVTPARLAGGTVMLLLITDIVQLLSCLLGWVAARISLRLKHKSLITVFITVCLLGAYYYFSFRMDDIIRALIRNAARYGSALKGSAHVLYQFGRIGEGDLAAAAGFAIGAAAATWLVWRLMSRSFLSLAASGSTTGKVRYVEKRVRQKTPFMALLSKELARFTASPNYMLNCGFGTLLIPVFGIFMLLKGRTFIPMIRMALWRQTDSPAVLICASLCILASMNDMAAPSVSLEGKSIWIPQSLPVEPGMVLRAKAALNLIFTAVPMLFAALCGASIVPAAPEVRLMMVLMPLVYTAFFAMSGTAVGVKMPMMNWTNETMPVKQSAGVAIVLFGSWLISLAAACIYLAVGYRIGGALYLLVLTVLFAAAALFLLRWLSRRGGRIFAQLP